jgi:hypothetical protein
MKLAQFSIVAIAGIMIVVICTGCMSTETPASAPVSIHSESPSMVPVTTSTHTGSTAAVKTDSSPVPDAPFITIDPISDRNTGRFPGPETIRYFESGSGSATIPGSGSNPSITVDPIGDHKKGDIFRITGTTNLIEGTMLQCTVWPEYYEDRSKRPALISTDDCDGQFIIAGAPAAIVKGTVDTNRWVCPVDLRISPENIGMIIHVSTTDEYFTSREVYGNATFNLN